MNVDGKPYRTIWLNDDGISVSVIDQILLPHGFKIVEWRTVEDVAEGIRRMVVRGAPLIGASAGYGIALGMLRDPSDKAFQRAYELLFASANGGELEMGARQNAGRAVPATPERPCRCSIHLSQRDLR